MVPKASAQQAATLTKWEHHCSEIDIDDLQASASKLGAAAADCVVIEDSPAGAASALGAGMRAIGYAPGPTHAAMVASGAHVIRSMSELTSAVAA